MLNSDALSQLKQLKKDIKASRNLACGEVKGTTNKFGFVALDSGKDVFLPPDEMLKVFPGDRVEVEIKKGEKNKDVAVIERLLKSELKEFVGRYIVKNKAQFVEPLVGGLNRWIYIPPNKRKQAKADDYIHCRILQHPLKNGKPQAEVKDIIGNDSDPGIEVGVITNKFKLREDWPQEVLDGCDKLGQDDIEALASDRRDLCDLDFVTIDSPYARDLDDALFVQRETNGWTLWVAIADPSSLVEPGSKLEKIAMKRASSCYFPGKQIPMLPPRISSELCSLLPKEKRPALVCEMKIDAKDGSINHYEIYEAMIRSRQKMSYEQVDQLLQSDPQGESADTIDQTLQQLKKLHQARVNWRNDQACPPQEQKEFNIQLDEKGKIANISPRPDSLSRKIVEECMIATNTCIAGFLSTHSTSSLYICHAGVRPDRINNIQTLIKQIDELQDLDVSSLQDFVKVMQQTGELKFSELQSIISRQLDRSQMQQQPGPHYGMGLENYTTATSPLRKANDYLVQKQLKAILAGQTATPPENSQIESIYEQQLDIRQAMNEVERWLKCEFAQHQGARKYEAEVIRCASAGFHVRTLDQGLEGFVSTRNMDQKFSFDELRLSLKSRSVTIQLDQVVHVAFKNVDWKNRQIQFTLIEDEADENTND